MLEFLETRTCISNAVFAYSSAPSHPPTQSKFRAVLDACRVIRNCEIKVWSRNNVEPIYQLRFTLNKVSSLKSHLYTLTVSVLRLTLIFSMAHAREILFFGKILKFFLDHVLCNPFARSIFQREFYFGPLFIIKL